MTKSDERIAIVGGVRTPFARAGGELKEHSALTLAVHSVNGLLERSPFAPKEVAVLGYGIVVLDPRLPHLAREVVFSSELDVGVRAVTLTDNCITGLTAIQSVADEISAGRAQIGIAGGVESMSNPPIMFNPRASRVFTNIGLARSLRQRVGHAVGLRPRDFLPDAPAIAEPSTGLSMGEHCELMVKEWGISREAQDEIALRSHMNAHAASEDGRLPAMIAPLAGHRSDPLIRPDTTLAKLAALRPVFDRTPSGTITAGSSSPLTDGAASVALMSESRAERDGIEPLAFIKGIEFASIAPGDGLLMAPGVAVPRLLRRLGMLLSDMDVVEMHEAFAGQIACNLAAWSRGWKESVIGDVPEEKLNPMGSSIALGHPFAATGVRIVATLAAHMQSTGARHGLVSVCGAGATAGAIVLERS